jgi:hypothetical protein
MESFSRKKSSSGNAVRPGWVVSSAARRRGGP